MPLRVRGYAEPDAFGDVKAEQDTHVLVRGAVSHCASCCPVLVLVGVTP